MPRDLRERLGLFARVLSGGTVAAGDAAEILSVVPRERIQAVVLTISDRCSRGQARDTAGPHVDLVDHMLRKARLGLKKN